LVPLAFFLFLSARSACESYLCVTFPATALGCGEPTPSVFFSRIPLSHNSSCERASAYAPRGDDSPRLPSPLVSLCSSPTFRTFGGHEHFRGEAPPSLPRSSFLLYPATQPFSSVSSTEEACTSTAHLPFPIQPSLPQIPFSHHTPLVFLRRRQSTIRYAVDRSFVPLGCARLCTR